MQEDEGADEHPKGQLLAMARNMAVVDVDEVGNPGDGGPRLFGVPRPIVTPGFLGPKCAEEHANGEEGEADIYKALPLRLSKNLEGNMAMTTATPSRA